MNRNKKIYVAIFGLILFLAAIGLVFYVMKLREASSSNTSNAALKSNDLMISYSSPNPEQVKEGDIISVSIDTVINSPITAAGNLILDFDPQALESVDAIIQPPFVLIDKNIDNTNGIISVQLGAPTLTMLDTSTPSFVVFKFKVKTLSLPNTKVTIDSHSTLGSPSTIDIKKDEKFTSISLGECTIVPLCKDDEFLSRKYVSPTCTAQECIKKQTVQCDNTIPNCTDSQKLTDIPSPDGQCTLHICVAK